jgi:uncharacterized phage-associated protein
MDAKQISSYVISLTQNNPEENLTNLKLQKILYYLQGYYLALYNESLFDDEIESWRYGPVISDVYHTYKGYGNNSIIIPEIDLKFDFILENQKKFINKVYYYYRQFSAIKLMELTHNEKPWLTTFGRVQIMSQDLLKEFFIESELINSFKDTDAKTERKAAAQFLLADYLYDSNLTELTSSDIDDLYEY